jgi:putative membrane-bound dehydrogenase-like protein
MIPRTLLLLLVPTLVFGQVPSAPKAPLVNDPSLRIELIATTPDVEACTTVCGDPRGAIYVGNDPRDGRLSTKEPVCTIVRFGVFDPPDQIRLPDGTLAPPVFHRKRTVFADKLYSPAGSAWHDGWLYVIHDPLMTRFKDTDGDGIADVREDLIENLGVMPQDGGLNDHCASGFTLGMDGFWYISIGDRGTFQTKSLKDGSTVTLQGGGIIRCRTDGTQLQIFSSGTRNHLQVNLDAEDNAFTRDNTDDGNGWWTRLTHHIEGGYYGYPYLYRRAPNYGVVEPSEQTLNAITQHGGTTMNHRFAQVTGEKEPHPLTPSFVRAFLSERSPFLTAMAGFGGGSPTGGLCYMSDGLPEKYRGKHFFSEWGKAGIFVTEVARDGATFKLVSDTKLIEPEKGGDFRPMQISVAADGSLLIADWCYGGWKSPRVAGAVWRLYWPEARPARRISEGAAKTEELVAALGHPDRDQRLRAQFALLAKFVPTAPGTGHATMSPAGAILKKLAAVVNDEGAPEVQRIHAIRTADAAADVLLAAVLNDKIGNMALSDQLTLAQGIAEGVAKSPSAAMRRESARAMRGLAGDSASEQFVRDADASVRAEAARSLGRIFATPMESAMGKNLRGRVTKRLLGLLADPDGWVRFTARHALARMGDWKAVTDALRKGDAAARAQLWLVLDKAYDEPLASLLAAVAKTEDTSLRSGAVEALGRIAYQPQPWDGHWWGTQPVKSAPPPNRVAWAGTPQALAALIAALGDSDAGVRLVAATAFTGFILDDAGKDAGAALRARLTAESDAAIRRQLIESLGVQKDPQAMDVFRQIALDEKADAEFRDTAIGAVVNIGTGGNAEALSAAKKTIAQLADAKLSPDATRKIITAAGELKVLDAAPALIAHLRDENAGNRESAAKSLQQLGPKSKAGPALIEAMADKDGKVQAAAVDALGSYREKAALPGIIALLEKKKHLRETTGALVLMPDESAIPVLVETLRDKNTTFRRNAIKALKTMREKAWPQVEALLASGRMPEELVPEIRNAFDSGAITKWKMVGVFENVWEAVHPPEKDVLGRQASSLSGQTAVPAVTGGSDRPEARLPGQAGSLSSGADTPLLARKYHNAEGKDVGWIDVTADSAEGRVDLEKIFKTSAMVCAYAFTEIEASQAADAKLFTSADDEIAVWLNGHQVLNQPGSHGYEPDKNETHLQLAGGKNQLFVKIGNKGGSWVFHARMPGFENGKFTKSKEPTPEEKQRAFATATKPDGTYVNAGDAKNGEKLFFEPTAALGGICATCHAVGNKGGQIGPALTTIGANYKRPDLITSLHEPSKTIALGFEQVMIETKSGETVAGMLRGEAADAFTIVDVAGQSHVVKKADVKKKTDLHVSLMPPGLTLGLKPSDFADLLAYLESLR